MRWPLKSVYITQHFGKNPELYKKFGLQGHNGYDLRAVTGTKVYAPHDGKITERTTDSDGYGKYIKVQNEKEGSVLAHLNKWLVELGQQVKEGDLIAESDNTGFSTAPHLHWGYYRLPRNRKNGFLGFIDQLPYLADSKGPTEEEMDACLADREKFWKERDEITKEFQEFKTKTEDQIADLERDNVRLKELSEQTQKLYDEFLHRLAELLGSAHTAQAIYAELEKAVKAEDQVLELRSAIEDRDNKIKGYLDAIQKLEARLEALEEATGTENTRKGGNMAAKKHFLDGKKTYVVISATILFNLLGALLGKIEWQSAITAILIILGIGGVRATKKLN